MQELPKNTKGVSTSQRSKVSGHEASILHFDPIVADIRNVSDDLRTHIMLLVERTQNENTLVSVLRTLQKEHGNVSVTLSSMTDVQGTETETSSSSSQSAAKSPLLFSSANLDRTEAESVTGSLHLINEKRSEDDHEGDLDADSLFASQRIILCGQQLIHGRRAAVSAESLPLNAIQNYTPPVVKKTHEEETVLHASVMACHLFRSMESSDRKIIVKALRREKFFAGKIILRQGGLSKRKLFLITEGTCEVIKNGSSVRTLHAGCTFGEMEMMYQQLTCAETVRSVTNCTIYTLYQETYQRIVLAASVHRRKKYEDFLSKIEFLSSLSNYDRMCIAEALVTKTYKKNDYIIRFGERGNWMHIIIEGEAKVVGRHMGKKYDILHLKEGRVAGELEFVFRHLTVADVVAASHHVVTAKIHRRHFELIAGSIRDSLKEYIARNEVYSHYLSVTNERSKAELSHSSKQSKRVADKGDRDVLLLDKVDAGGEIIIPVLAEKVIDKTAPSTKTGSGMDSTHQIETLEKTKSEALAAQGLTFAPESTHILFRFPLMPLHTNSLAMIGLREDGSVLMWNDMMTHFTGYTAGEAIGHHISSFLLETRDQRNMHDSIGVARHYTGNVETFMVEKDMGRWICYTFAHVDGISKVRLKLTVVPSVISHGKEGSEMVLAVGDMVRRGPQKALDKSGMLTDQIGNLLRNSELTYEDRFHRITALLSSFDSAYQAITAPTEDVRAVNIRQMIGQVIMDYGAQCVVNAVTVRQRFEDLYADVAYIDAKLLPECLRYAMHNCSKHLDDAQVTITVTITENNGLEFLVIAFHDNGPGLPSDLVKDFHEGCAAKKYPQINHVRAAMEQQGGNMFIESVPGDTCVTFVVPFAPELDGTMVEDSVCERAGEDLSESRSASVALQASLSIVTTATKISERSSPPSPSPPPPPPQKAQHTYTTLVVEDVPVHRNMLCSFLWDQKHVVLPAYNLSDIEELIDVADILFIDPHQSFFAGTAKNIDPITLLLEKARRMAVVITGTDMDEDSAKAYHTAGFLTLKKPCTSIRAIRCIRLAEGTIANQKLEAERIMRTRETLSKNSHRAWKRGKLVGKGVFGEVYEATDILTGGKMAVKEIQLGKHNLKMEQFVDEISTMYNLHHPNIIHYFYCEENKKENVVSVFMEYAAGGNLKEWLQKKGAPAFKKYQSLLHDIVEGVAYIHSMGYVHCDLKTANILLSSDGKGKIGDFGTAKTIEYGELLYQMQGSPLYMSPECMAAGDRGDDGVMIGYSFPSDIWSLGCIALEMATNSPPFSHLKNIKGPMGLMNYITSLHDIPDLSPLFDGPPSIVEFVSACLNPDPFKRATADDLRQLSIFSEAPDENMKSALHALKRAQLLHVLNSFVAFQEPEDAGYLIHRNSDPRGRQIRCNSDFLNSTSSSTTITTAAIDFPLSLPKDAAGVKEGSSGRTGKVETMGECFEYAQTTSRLQIKTQSPFTTRLRVARIVEEEEFFSSSSPPRPRPRLGRTRSFPAASTVTTAPLTDQSREKFDAASIAPSLNASFFGARNSFAVPNLSIHFMGTSIDAVPAGAHEVLANTDSSAVATPLHFVLPSQTLHSQQKEAQGLHLKKGTGGKRSSYLFSSLLRHSSSNPKSSAFALRYLKRKMKMMFSVENIEPSSRDRNSDTSRPSRALSLSVSPSLSLPVSWTQGKPPSSPR